MTIPSSTLAYLQRHFRQARPILFTGAGFSTGARNRSGEPIPGYSQLLQRLWEICFPDTPLEAGTTLQDLYEAALLNQKRRTEQLLRELLTVDPSSIPSWYGDVLSLSWRRVYTLNIDDLIDAAARRDLVARDIRAISALDADWHDASVARSSADRPLLEVIHLNGTLAGLPDRITFSRTQYARRQANPDPVYVQLTAELMSQPIIFIGTTLEEPSLWTHIELRLRRGGRDAHELRPKSVLVSPDLPLAKRALLSQYNIEWLPLTAEQFATAVVPDLQADAAIGRALLVQQCGSSRVTRERLPEVAELATNVTADSEFLTGQAPTWADIHRERAVAREADHKIAEEVTASLRTNKSRCIIITGTAGAGKSTALMRTCLKLAGDGVRVGWIDSTSEWSPHDIRRAMRRDDAPRVIAIDDLDIYGRASGSLLADLLNTDKPQLVLAALRSTKVEDILSSIDSTNPMITEHVMPPLADQDIDRLLEVLDKENRLGILKGRPQNERVAAFQHEAGRQLLVAMYQATSGRRFTEKVREEFSDLGATERTVYAVVIVASAHRFGLSKQEILVALGGDSDNVALNALDRLERRHILVLTPTGEYRTRHRFFAETLFNMLAQEGSLATPLIGLSYIAATAVRPTLPRNSRPWRLLRLVIHHDFLARTIGVESARRLYGGIEDLLKWDSHYWLQRGSFEVQFGDLSLAENFLLQSNSLAPSDPLVMNELAYLRFKQAIADPTAIGAQELVDGAVATLEDLNQLRGRYDAYSYHVLGTQGLMWSRSALLSKRAKRAFLERLSQEVESGINFHPGSRELRKLGADLKKALLELAIPEGSGDPSP